MYDKKQPVFHPAKASPLNKIYLKQKPKLKQTKGIAGLLTLIARSEPTATSKVIQLWLDHITHPIN